MRMASWCTLILLAGLPVCSLAQDTPEQHLEIGTNCAKAFEPRQCMESYGFRCHQSKSYSHSIDAQRLGCNLDLNDGRLHFVQMLYQDGTWYVDRERSYVPDQDIPKSPHEDPSRALDLMLEQKLDGFSESSSGGRSIGGNQTIHFMTGTRRIDRRLAVVNLCGLTLGHQSATEADSSMAPMCEKDLMRSIRKMAQTDPEEPYRVPAPTEIHWEREVVTILSGDTTLILKGTYRFPDVHTPCRLKSNCCSTDGVVYFQSCRTPSTEELAKIQTCLTEGHRPRTSEFDTCLVHAGVALGCELQGDGSSVCR